MSKIVIVGRGIFGSVAAHLALTRRKVKKVVMVDSCMDDAASKAAACLIKPSWLNSLNHAQIELGYEVLNLLYNVETLQFNSGICKVNVSWVPPWRILESVSYDVEYLENRVNKVGDGCVTLDNGDTLKGKVLVAAGSHCGELVIMPPIKSLMGLSLIFRGSMEPRIVAYAPYKQAIAFNIDKERIWFGNGVSILRKNWETSIQLEKAVEQAKKLFGLTGNFSYEYGARPYVEGYKAGYFSRIHHNTWVSTGGAKNGTILAAFQASRFVKEAEL